MNLRGVCLELRMGLGSLGWVKHTPDSAAMVLIMLTSDWVCLRWVWLGTRR